MLKQLKKGDVPVLYEITGLRGNGMNYFKLNSKEYTIFPNEKEVLLSTGLYFDIVDIQQKQHHNG